MIDAKCVTADGIKFIVTNEIDIDGEHYMLAIDSEKEKNIMICKTYLEDGKEMFTSVTDEDELKKVINKFQGENV